MDQLTNYKHRIDYLLSNETSLIQPIQTVTKYKHKKRIRCNECNKKRKPSYMNDQICHVCYKTKVVFNQKPSGNRVIDDFIRHTQVSLVKKGGKMEFVPYSQFKDVKYIAEGGFSKIYKATWVDGPLLNYELKKPSRNKNYIVVLKKLNNSKNITSKELNELQVFYDFSTKWRDVNNKYVSEYFGITQDPGTQEIMIIMPYYESDLIHYITKDFYNISWKSKLETLRMIICGLENLHNAKIYHRDLHSGNILYGDGNYLFYDDEVLIGDLGISKSATSESTDVNENYGIIPYMAPEIFLGQKYAEYSDIYSFGMIMWELMTGRRPFWDRNHDTGLIIDIIDGIRPPIVTNAPKGYIKLMKECWHSDPNERPTATDVYEKVDKIRRSELYKNGTKIIVSPDIGPVKSNNPGAIYKSRPLSGLIQSAVSLRSSRNQSINLEFGKGTFVDNPIEDDFDNDQKIKRRKLLENVDEDYVTKEIKLDIIMNSNKPRNNEYFTRENGFDI